MSISTLIQSELVNIFSLQDLISYLWFEPGWNKVESKQGWHVFVSDSIVSPTELEIVLPDEYDEYTAPTYMASALDLLSNVKEVKPELLAQSIDRYESDYLYIRNTGVRGNDSIQLSAAVKLIRELKNMVQHAADMESRNVPYDVLTHTTEAATQINRYRFGHTFRGSFGFSLEAPLMDEAEKELQRPFDRAYSDRTVPTSRKIMERIARGLQLTSEAANERTSDWIVNNYEEGLNANMCKSLIAISEEARAPVEYSVLWSPVLQVKSQVAHFRSVLIDDDELVYLQIAETKLKELRRPEHVQVRGLVLQVSTTDDPLGNVATRNVIVRWLNNPFSRQATQLTMNVDANDYKIAHALNIDWTKNILVEGEAEYIKGKGWHLHNPKNFRVESAEE